jgi:hypothetical protein
MKGARLLRDKVSLKTRLDDHSTLGTKVSIEVDLPVAFALLSALAPYAAITEADPAWQNLQVREAHYLFYNIQEAIHGEG